MQGTTDPYEINVGGTIFTTTKTTLSISPFLATLLEHVEEGKQLFLDEDPDVFKFVLNLLRDNTYPFPIELQGRLDYYGLTPEFISQAKSFKHCMKTLQPITTKIDIDETRENIGGNDTGNTHAFSFISLAAKGQQNCTTVPLLDGYTNDHVPNNIECPLSDTGKCVIPRNMDTIHKAYAVLQFKWKKGIINFDNIINKIELRFGGFSTISYTGTTLNMMTNFEKSLVKLTQENELYEIWFELPYILQHDIPMIAMMYHSVEIDVIMNSDNVKYKAGKLIIAGKYHDAEPRKKMIENDIILPLMQIQEHHWIVTGKHPIGKDKVSTDRLRITHLITAIYFRILDINRDQAINIKYVQLRLNGHSSCKYYGVLLPNENNVYKLDLEKTTINASRIDNLGITVKPYWEENDDIAVHWKISAVFAIANEVRFCGGMCGVRYAC